MHGWMESSIRILLVNSLSWPKRSIFRVWEFQNSGLLSAPEFDATDVSVMRTGSFHKY